MQDIPAKPGNQCDASFDQAAQFGLAASINGEITNGQLPCGDRKCRATHRDVDRRHREQCENEIAEKFKTLIPGPQATKGRHPDAAALNENRPRQSTLISATCCGRRARRYGNRSSAGLGLRIDLIKLPPRKAPVKHQVGNPHRNQEQKNSRLDNRIAIRDRACTALVNSSSAELRQRETCPSGLSCARRSASWKCGILETGKGDRV